MPGLRHTGLHSAPLVQRLAALDGWGGPATSAAAPWPDALSRWLGWADAIALSAVLNRPPPAQTVLPAAKVPLVAAPTRDAATEASLAAAVQACAQAVAHTRQALASSLVPALAEVDAAAPTDFTGYRRWCAARQRAMSAQVGALRARVRTVLAGSSSALAPLAAIDAALDKALATREQHLLSTTTLRLEQHFERLRLVGAAGWRGQFDRELQAVLLAELDLRMQPVEGLLDALKDEAQSPR